MLLFVFNLIGFIIRFECCHGGMSKVSFRLRWIHGFTIFIEGEYIVAINSVLYVSPPIYSKPRSEDFTRKQHNSSSKPMTFRVVHIVYLFDPFWNLPHLIILKIQCRDVTNISIMIEMVYFKWRSNMQMKILGKVGVLSCSEAFSHRINIFSFPAPLASILAIIPSTSSSLTFTLCIKITLLSSTCLIASSRSSSSLGPWTAECLIALTPGRNVFTLFFVSCWRGRNCTRSRDGWSGIHTWSRNGRIHRTFDAPATITACIIGCAIPSIPNLHCEI